MAYPQCDRATFRPRTRAGPRAAGSNTRGLTGQTGLKSLWYPTHSHASESLHFGSLPTGRDDPPAGGVPRKLAGRSLGAANRHPSGTLLCLHVSMPWSYGQELTPLLPLDATRSSPCRRLGYIVTEGSATTSTPPAGMKPAVQTATQHLAPGRAYNISLRWRTGPPAR